MGKTTVVNLHHLNGKMPENSVYIGRGRGSKWGNPFSHMKGTKAEHIVATREEAVEAYRKWIFTQPNLLDDLRELKGKVLVCYCAPLACHGHVLAELADKFVADCGCVFIDGTCIDMCQPHLDDMNALHERQLKAQENASIEVTECEYCGKTLMNLAFPVHVCEECADKNRAKRVLECSSKGDKRFSAFYANVTLFGKTQSIENWYQLSKRFGTNAPASIEEVKGKKKVYTNPTHFEVNGITFPIDRLSEWYKLLWFMYLDNNPELADYASRFDTFTDMFRGKSVNCQADVIAQYVTDRESLVKEIVNLMDELLDSELPKKQQQPKKGKTLCFTGHRPDKLGVGYSITSEKVAEFSANLSPIIEEMIKDGYTRFISGAAIGVDQIAFWTVNKLKKKYPHIENAVAVPFKDQPSVWKSNELRSWYDAMLKRADKVVYVDEWAHQKGKSKYIDPKVILGKFSAQKLLNRNKFMVDYSDRVLAVYHESETSGGTAHCVRYARAEGKEVTVIAPSALTPHAK